jgi:glucan phosphoethanolaminetransferase (alkaline phosphatase superfamily)
MDEALRSLCSTSQTFLGVIIMIILILGVLLHIVNYVLNLRKPKASKKTFLWLGGNAFLVLFVLGIIVYVVMPLIINALVGTEYPCTSNQPPTPPYSPYCGNDYCANGMNVSLGGNCTCIQY